MVGLDESRSKKRNPLNPGNEDNETDGMEGLELIRDLGSVVLAAAIVGWICQRIGLSVIVGYLAAGVLAGPHVPWLVLVEDYDRITTLSQIGLVFLMFSMGLQLSVGRLRSLGASVVVAVAISAVIVLLAARMMGAFAGLSALQGMFFAGVMMVSSSAIIGKSLVEARRSHERSGQTVLAITLLEDVVAAAMLALLTSYVVIGGGETGVGKTVGLLAAFVTLLLIGGLLVVPWLLRWFSVGPMRELQTLIVAGLLFTLAYFAQKAGYSIALGSFILGAVVAETKQRGQIDRAFGGLRDLFSAVFFVAIGMMIDVSLYGSLWWLVLVLSVVVVLLRSTASAIGAIVAGRPLEEAVEAGLSLTPIGEFSFVIAGIAVAAGLFDASFQALVVGAAIVTALTAPMLTRHAPALAGGIVRRTSRRFRRVLGGYRRWLDRTMDLHAGSVVWQLSKRRILQIGVGILFTTGWLVFVPMFEEPIAVWTSAPSESLVFHSAFWCAILLFAAVPLVAVWRNISAMSMLYAEVASAGFSNSPGVRVVAENAIKAMSAAVLILWFGSLLPFEPSQLWFVAGVGLVALLLLWFFWTSMVRWHSELEIRIGETLQQDSGGRPTQSKLIASAARGWDWTVEECVVPENAAVAGRTITELALRTKFSSTIVAIDRQGFAINNPRGSERLFPLDVVLVAGTPASIRHARGELEAEAVDEGAGVSDVIVERVEVPAGCARVGIPLAESRTGIITGAQIAGIRRAGVEIPSPDGSEHLQEGDVLLVIGNRAQLDKFHQWLEGPA